MPYPHRVIFVNYTLTDSFSDGHSCFLVSFCSQTIESSKRFINNTESAWNDDREKGHGQANEMLFRGD